MLWTKSVKTSCVLESSGALCIKISAQVEKHKIRSVSPHCIINTPLFISMPIESVQKKMLPPIKYWYNFLPLHVEKVIKKTRCYTLAAGCWMACRPLNCQTQQNTGETPARQDITLQAADQVVFWFRLLYKHMPRIKSVNNFMLKCRITSENTEKTCCNYIYHTAAKTSRQILTSSLVQALRSPSPSWTWAF